MSIVSVGILMSTRIVNLGPRLRPKALMGSGTGPKKELPIRGKEARSPPPQRRHGARGSGLAVTTQYHG